MPKFVPASKEELARRVSQKPAAPVEKSDAPVEKPKAAKPTKKAGD